MDRAAASNAGARSEHNFLSPDLSLQRPRRLTTTGSQKGHDLFLDLANDGAEAGDSTTQTGRRKSSLNSTSPSRTFKSAGRSLSASSPTYPILDTPIPRHPSRNTPQASSLPSRRRGSAVENSSSMRPFRPSYKPSQLSSVTYDAQHPISPPYSSTWLSDPSPLTPPCTDGVESVGSVTAVSTVWDEVEDLKGRIERYRSSGRRLNSAGVNMDDGGDRPRTATTVTTNSTSSHARVMKSFDSMRVDSTGNKTHGLLRTALTKVRNRIDANTFNALDACALDAISASEMLDLNSDGLSTINDQSNLHPDRASADKRLKRKVDSLCRSLTELCIALMEDGSRNGARLTESRQMDHAESLISPQEKFNSSNHLNDRQDRRSHLEPGSSDSSRTSGVLSRNTALSNRRDASRPSLSTRQSRASRETTQRRFSLTASSSDYRTTNRMSTVFSQGDSEDRDSTIRAPSMAATDVPPPRFSPRLDRNKSSRDYIDHSPDPDARSPTLRETLAINHSQVSLNSAHTTMTNADKYRTRRDLALRDANYAPTTSSLLEQRLEQRRKQQKVSSANQLGSITGLPDPSRNYSRQRAASNTSKRPSSRDQSNPRYGT